MKNNPNMNEFSAYQRYLGYDFTKDDSGNCLDIEKSIVNDSFVDLSSLKLKFTLPNFEEQQDNINFGVQNDSIYVTWINIYGYKPAPPKALLNFIIDK